MLRIRPSQKIMFQAMASKRFEDSLVQHLQELFPAQTRSMSEAEIREMIKYAVRKAKSYGIKSERGIAKYAEVMQYLGVNFDQDHKLPWALYLLTDKQKSSPTERINALHHEVLRRASATNEHKSAGA